MITRQQQFAFMTMFSSLAVAWCLLLYFMYLFFMPASHWLEYESVTPEKEVFEVGEELRFVSNRVVHRKVNLEFDDVLYCADNSYDRDRFMESYQSSTVAYPTNGLEEAHWNLNRHVGYATDCYLRSNITLKLPWGVKKHIVINGPRFDVR